MKLTFFLNEPDIYLVVFEIDPGSIPGGIDGLKSEFNDRYTQVGPLLAIANVTKKAFHDTPLSENAISALSDDGSRFYVVDGDISMIIR